MNRTKQTQIQAFKPYASLANKDTIHFGAKNSKDSMADWEKKCLSIGIKQEKIDKIKQKAANSPVIQTVSRSTRSNKIYSEQRKALERLYNTVLEDENRISEAKEQEDETNSGGSKLTMDGPNGKLAWRSTGWVPDSYFWEVQEGKR